MVTPVQLQLDSCHYKCRNCHKLHVAPTRIVSFNCVEERQLDRGIERIYEADFTTSCDCDQPINITFQVREYPEGIFDYHGNRSSNAEVLLPPKVREHEVLVDLL